MLAGIVAIAVAQSAAPGASPGFGDAAELHPIPPLPYQVRSPMPSLPPRGASAPGELSEPPQPRGRMLPNGDGSYTAYLHEIVAHIDDEGRVSFSDSGGFDADGAFGHYGAVGYLGRFAGLNGLMGDDPNRLDKQRFLADTFADRRAMRVERRAVWMEAALRDLPRYLAAIWHHDPWSIQFRKRILFELWDECAEHGDPFITEGGAAARAVIENFVRRYIPADSADAFTAKELRALNGERMSLIRFDPYGDES